MHQQPAPDSALLRWKGDTLDVTLTLDQPRAGRAVLRTNLGGASVRRQEIIAETEKGTTPLAKAWRDIPLRETAPGTFACTLPLAEVGIFSGKCCFFPAGSTVPEWPQGSNFHVKVEPDCTRMGNAIYTIFPRQFGSFRAVVRRLDHIMDRLGFRIVQTLPPFPVPVSYGVMGKCGCPFAATDFFSVDPALAEFDRAATPLDQFRELVDAVHGKRGLFFVDLPANHTGWASTLQTHHPDWFQRAADGTFISPGAWGVTWADLVALDYAHPALCAYMAEVFLFWCRQGVDGFRCDAGYMIPERTWTYIVARVREEYPDTIFMLEGLGGKIEVTDALLAQAGLDWAYSEIFQTYDRAAFERYLPGAIARAEKYGTLVHFAETHDNDRLAKGGETYARLRVTLAALLAHQGAWGITNGVEWLCTEKIDVHDKNDLFWDNPHNIVDLIAHLNRLLVTHPDFTNNAPLELITQGPGNVLAVVRGQTLILANLDCAQASTVYWDETRFPAGAAYELLRGQEGLIASGFTLPPGACACFTRVRASDVAANPKNVSARDARVPFLTWHWPQDAQRDVVVPQGVRLTYDCPYPYRALILEGAHAFPALPPYEGDGTRVRRLTLEFTAFTPAGVKRTRSAIVIPPSAQDARVRLFYPGALIREDPTLETILGNGAGAAARVKLAWGEIRSQYDALFAANTCASVPGDRLVLWTRCRAWLQHEGYSRELNKDCLQGFHADPAGRFATWHFRVPCGMGRAAAFDFTLALQSNVNAATLSITRVSAGADEVGQAVRLVLRPDLEWRSFHATTKAQGAVEQAFGDPQALAARANGFTFNPYHTAEMFHMELINGVFHVAPEWTYCVSHSEEAERAQEPCGDVYSPGWIALDCAAPTEKVPRATHFLRALYSGEMSAQLRRDERSFLKDELLPVPEALKEALRLFIVRRDDVKTVIAGYPWFLDWGRDTFIFLRGAIAAGTLSEALAIVQAFARFEARGTLPNIIYGETAGNRDTVDAPLWFIIAVRELARKMGRQKVLSCWCGARTLADVLDSIVTHYVSGTANGIHVDEESGLVWAPAHFTWMDTNYPACTPRTGYAVEIQALWLAALRFVGGAWKDLASRVAESLVRYFANGTGLADCLDAPNGERAAEAKRDDAIRPNQLFALSLDAIDDPAVARQILSATERLLVPGGIRSLDAAHPLYKGVYAGDEDTCRKQAYHNGTVWAWPFALYAEAAARTGLWTKDAALGLLASAVENINTGCVCQMSEIADGNATHAQKGCRAQAWSISETLRVWLALAEKRQSV